MGESIVKKGIAIVVGLLAAGAATCSGEELWCRTGTRSHFGAHVAPAGDLDGDGRPDLLVAETFLGSSGEKVSVLSSTGQVIIELQGQQNGEGLGWSMDALDDVDGDGTRDVIAGAPSYETSGHRVGRVYVFSGRTGQIVWTREGLSDNGQGPRLGLTVRRSPDLDGDGIDDVLACAPDAGLYNQGVIYAFSGADGRALWKQSGEGTAGFPGGEFGMRILPTHDMNDDGVADLFASDPWLDRVGDIDVWGKIYLLSGRDGSPLPFSIVNTDSRYRIGFTLLSTGDVDRDGVHDIVHDISEIAGLGDQGRVVVYSVKRQKILRTFREEQGFGDTDFGRSAATLDYDGDGKPEVAVAAPGYPSEGRVLLFSVATGRFLGYIRGAPDTAYSSFGWSISTAGDMDGDGDDDLAIGDPEYIESDSARGQVCVYGGRQTPQTPGMNSLR